ncbi:MAG: hypothetical protein PHC69_00080 [Ruminiclostridium sp.]|nr:hypothetical protein [Ruminiclostridium sp.]
MKSLCTDEVITLYLSGIGIHPQKHTESITSLQNALLMLEKMLSPTYNSMLTPKEKAEIPDRWIHKK